MKKLSFIICISMLLTFNINFNIYAQSLIMEKPEGNLKFNLEKDSNYFINLIGILPGEHYYKELTIENNSIYPYNLYFKVSSKKGLSNKSLKLLNYINMKIICDNKVIYDGITNGKKINQNSSSLEQKMLLGTYYPNDKKTLKVYLSVSKTLDESYNNLKSFTTWDFYSERNSNLIFNNTNDNLSKNIHSNNLLKNIIPYTGDSLKLYYYLMELILCILIMIFLNRKKLNKQDFK